MRFGSIPACAGEPNSKNQNRVKCRVYLRVCGGTSPAFYTRNIAGGLSPRVRGNQAGSGRSLHVFGSIPACAGEPPPLCPRYLCPGVYPRVCGGTAHSSTPCACIRGLSPRVRGNLACPGRRLGDERSIPACAGEPQQDHISRRAGQVYPRVCGGTKVACGLLLRLRGLSPRVRGNLGTAVPSDAAGLSIPACAGEPPQHGVPPFSDEVYPRVCGGTPPQNREATTPRVYPRVCGGTRQPAPVSGDLKGLSPRVRGNLGRPRTREPAGRSIPACAGEPVPAFGHRGRTGVYPRVCGGTPKRDRAEYMRKGLSPRVRGNRRTGA